jgi:hypothetical protein
MPIREATYYEVECDHEGCGINLFDLTGEHTAWKQRDTTVDCWTDADGVVLDDGRTLCEKHRPIEDEDEDDDE